jgi:hypothetical protein
MLKAILSVLFWILYVVMGFIVMGYWMSKFLF